MTTVEFKNELKKISDTTLDSIIDMLYEEQESRYLKKREENICKIANMLAEIDALCEQENIFIRSDFEYLKGEEIYLRDLSIN